MESPMPQQMLEYRAPPAARAWTFARVMKWLSMYPPLTGAFVYGTWLVAAVTLGRAPVVYDDDPSGINWLTSALQSGAVLLLVMGVPFSFVHVIMATVGLVGSVAEESAVNRRQFRWCAASVAGWAGLWLLVWWDPGRVADWLMD